MRILSISDIGRIANVEQGSVEIAAVSDFSSSDSAKNLDNYYIADGSRPMALNLLSFPANLLTSKAIGSASPFERSQIFFSIDTNTYWSEYSVIDIDGDGDKDIVAFLSRYPLQNLGVPIKVLLNDGSGGFTDGTSKIFPNGAPLTVHPRGVVSQDFNGDGRPDILIVDHGYDTPPFPGFQNTLLLSSGTSGFVDATNRLPLVSDFSHSTTAGDIDGDGDIDALVLNVYGGTPALGELTSPYILINDGSGNFTRRNDLLPKAIQDRDENERYLSSLFFDADGDGDLDLFVGSGNAGYSKILLNDGAGRFDKISPITLPTGPWGVTNNSWAMSAKPIDLNGDGRLDLIVDFNHGDMGHYLQFLINNGAGSWSDETEQRLPQSKADDGFWINNFNLVDLNGDGFSDLITRNGEWSPVYINDGTGKFIHLPTSFLDVGGFGTPGAFNVIPLDANGDGRLDLILQTNNGWMYVFKHTDPGPSQTGTDQADGLLGDSSDEVLSGLSGDDIIFGGLGNDTLLGGVGNDYLNGGAGSDAASYTDALSAVTVNLSITTDQNTGGSGSDTLFNIENLVGSSFNDTLTGDAGANSLDGGAGDDSLVGGAGNDVLSGGLGNDLLDGGLGLDLASYSEITTNLSIDLNLTTAQSMGSAGNDTLISIEGLIGGSGNDSLVGNASDNILSGGAGNDTLLGGAGNDSLVGGAGNDRLDGGAGLDVASFVGLTTAIEIDLSNFSGIITTALGTDTLISIEGLVGGSGNDVLKAGTTATYLDGGAGNDFLGGSVYADTLIGGTGDDGIAAGAGNDSLDGGAGDDTLLGQAGDDTISGGIGRDFMDGGDGADTINAGDANDLINGGNGNDVINGDAGNDSIYGDAGNDVIDGGAGDDDLSGGNDNDTITGGTGDDRIAGGFGNDILNGGDGNDTISANDGDDTITGGLGVDNLYGFTGNDTIDGGDGNDTLLGMEGDDTVRGGTGADYIVGGDGTDTLYGDDGDDNMQGNDGNDTLNGGLGNDGLDGGAGNDTLNGDAGNDYLGGGEGNDILNGGDGNDVFVGGAGKDTLTGGAGADAFFFTALTDSTSAATDKITDFSWANGDYINLSQIDANSAVAGDQAFSFVNSFTKQAGQATLSYDAASNTSTFSADVDGDGVADFVLQITGQLDTSNGWVL